MDTSVLDSVTNILNDITICDRCLGRQFAWLSTLSTNDTRGHSLKLTLSMQGDIYCKGGNKEKGENLLRILAENGMFEPAKSLCERYGIDVAPKNQCQLCDMGDGSIFDRIPSITERVTKKTESIEFDSFLAGCTPIGQLAESNDEIRAKYGLLHAEPLKSDFNRELGKELSRTLERDVNFERPDVVVFYDMGKDNVELRINPVFIYGRYRKLKRGIPQSRWDCRKCRGKGCEACSGTGRNYQDSVSEYIALPILKELKGSKFKFHAAGREDIDVLMLGTGRPFVVEISEPEVRHPNLEDLVTKVNKPAKEIVEIGELEITTRKKLQTLKVSASESIKEYHALIKAENEVTKESLKLAEKKLSGAILKQQTPKRVSHRRSNLIRDKQVFEARLSVKGTNEIEAYFKVQGGTYIKELISGDEGRTTPSLTEVLQIQCICTELEVIAVHS